MKIDYNKLMKEEINTLTKKPKLVLQVCCAPCTSAVVNRLKDKFDLVLLFFNPNIYPEREYFKRRAEFKKLGVEVVDLGYKHEEFLNAVKGLEQEKEGGPRCKTCIALRLRASFRYAKQINADYVCTTLTISPHKDAEYINTTGKYLEEEFGVKFLYADFKKENGYLESIKLCKELNIYRQDYCGCEFGKNEE